MYYFSNLFDKSTLHVSDRSTVHYQEYLNTVYTQYVFVILILLEWQIPVACIQCWDTPDDGQWTCPKHVEYFYQINLRNSASRWLSLQEYITMHGPLNVKCNA